MIWWGGQGEYEGNILSQEYEVGIERDIISMGKSLVTWSAGLRELVPSFPGEEDKRRAQTVLNLLDDSCRLSARIWGCWSGIGERVRRFW